MEKASFFPHHSQELKVTPRHSRQPTPPLISTTYTTFTNYTVLSTCLSLDPPAVNHLPSPLEKNPLASTAFSVPLAVNRLLVAHPVTPQALTPAGPHLPRAPPTAAVLAEETLSLEASATETETSMIPQSSKPVSVCVTPRWRSERRTAHLRRQD